MSDQQEPTELSAQKRALFAIRDLKARLEAVERARTEPIAIVGMACRLPGASNVDEYWTLLRDGVDAIRPVPRDRWDVDALYDPDPDAPGKTYCRDGGFVDQIDKFDASFFGIPPREVASMDPQQRMLLEVSWEALEDAGMPPAGLTGSNTGVFVGLGTTDYTEFTIHNPDSTRIDAYVGTGGAPCVAAGRISFVLGLKGSAMTVDTACSSSLVAVDLAVQQLRAGKSRMVLAGGVNAILSARSTVYLSKIRALSLSGRCRSFDASADGYARGEGCGMLVLKRLSDAQRDGDRVRALIRGAASNHDGRSSGLTVPNGAAQEDVIRLALADAGLEPAHVQYIEAHGTGTPLGDPIEIRALGAVFGRGRPHPLVVGTVKTNIGHLEAASGVAGIIKIVLSMQHGLIPRTLHFVNPNPHIPWDDLDVTIAREPMPWPDASMPAIAGISGYGFSGTNAHVILEAAPAAAPDTAAPADPLVADRPQHLLAMSAATTAGLADLAQRYERLCLSEGAPAAGDMAFSAHTGRSHFDHRVAIVGENTGRFVQALHAVAQGQDHPLVIRGRVDTERPKIAFLFTGQGSQYVGMGRELYETDPTFRKTLQECDEILRPLLDRSILAVIHGATPAEAALIDQTAYTQPALFALEYALAALWRSWGIEPSFVMGHSLGEYVAACVSGLCGLEDGLRLIAKRARLMQSLPAGGRMAAVFAAEAIVADAIRGAEGAVAIAAINGPEHVVVSGAGEVVASVLSTLSARGIKSQELVVSHAFHSPLMDPILDEFERAVARVIWQAPRVRLVSNLTGEIASAEIATPAYWRRHLRAPVRFSASVETIASSGCNWLLEVGPHPTLLGMAGRFLPDGQMLSLPSLRKGQGDTQQMLRTLGTMYTRGADVNWRAFDNDRSRHRVSLPHYPFQRSRHWAESSRTRPSPVLASNEAETHPMLGARIRSPLLQGHVFQFSLPASGLRFLDDHVVYGTAVFPATGYVEIAAAGARCVFGTTEIIVEDFAVEEPLALPEGSAHAVQATFTPIEGGGASFQVFSRDASSSDAEAGWSRHATGTVRMSVAQPAPAGDSIADIRRRCDRPVDAAELYERLEHHGIHYGPAFRGMTELWRGADEALGRLSLPSGLEQEAAQFGIHPAFLDAALQVLGATVAGDDEGTDVFLPVGVSRIVFRGAAPSQIWSHARLLRGPSCDDTLRADLRWYDEDGGLVWEATGVTMKRASRHALQRASDRRIDEWLYEIAWQAAEPAAPASASTSGTWLIFADHNGVGVRLASEIRSRGGSPVLVRAGTTYAKTAEGYSIDPMCREHFGQLIEDAGNESALAGAVHLWSLDAPETLSNVDDLDRAVAGACGTALHLVKALASARLAASPSLALITRGAVAVGQAPWPVQIAQAPIWGMARTIAVEQPQWRFGVIDVDPMEAGGDPGRLADEVLTLQSENQIAWRAGARFVARLVRRRRNQPGERRLALPAAEGFQLTTSARGVIDNLCFEPRPRPVPGPGQVEVRVHAGGLNFRDVLNALGMYPGDPGPMGGECAGRVTAVGAGLSGVRVGDEVMCMAGGSFGRYVITPEDAVVRLPAGLTFEQGASIPITFLTAHYGLHHIAGIKKGDRVLVHAAAGGVGQAAVQLALRAGAEVFGTAGSAEKREYVKALGVRHVFSSRTSDFTAELMTLTGGQGVDVVLNSLTGAFIPESLKVLKQGGHFLEIGKAEIWSPEAVAAVNPGATYTPFDLGEVLLQQPATIATMFGDIVTGLGDESLRPLPIRVYDIRDAQAAFRYMAQAKHIGKLVLSQREVIADEAGSGVDPLGTYLVSGGAGGLGLKVAEWLVSRSARHVVLTGRSEPSADAARAMHALRSAGATVTFARGDISREADVRRILDDIAATPYPLRGVVHAAGVLDDGLLTDLDWSRFEMVMAPKVRGGWLLHRLTQAHRLDFFILFSSTSAVLGAPGQANYAAANAFLDGLAQCRRAQGAPALSVNWGAWSEVGMAARLQGRDQSRIADRGIGTISPEAGVRTMGLLLNQADANVTVLPVRWQAFLDAYAGPVPAMLRVVAKGAAARQQDGGKADAARSGLKARLQSVPESEQEDVLLAFLREQVAKVLGLDAGDSLEADVPFTSLGLDSLMAVELRNAVAASMGKSLPASLTFDYPSMAALAGFMAKDMVNARPAPAAVAAVPVESQWAAVAGQLDDLSADEMAERLASQLAALGGAEGQQR